MLVVVVINLDLDTTPTYVVDVLYDVWAGSAIDVGVSIGARTVGDVLVDSAAVAVTAVMTSIGPGAAVEALTDICVNLLGTVMAGFEATS